MKRKAGLLVVLLLSFVIFSCTMTVYADEDKNDSSDVFQLTLYADDSLATGPDGVDLSGIKIDVYSSELTDYNAEPNGSTFTHNEAFSVYTDAEGKVQFSRPSEEYLIFVDVSTLPRNTGIAIPLKFYRKEITQDALAISKVDHIVIDKIETSEDDFYVNAYNREGTRINVDYTLTEISNDISGDTKTVCLEARVGDITETGVYSIPVSEQKESEIHCVEDADDMLAYAEDIEKGENDTSEEMKQNEEVITGKSGYDRKNVWKVFIPVAVSFLLVGGIIFGWQYHKKRVKKEK